MRNGFLLHIAIQEALDGKAFCWMEKVMRSGCGDMPRCRLRVVSNERKLLRNAGSCVARSCQNARRAPHNGDKPSSWETAFWMMMAWTFSAWATAIRNPTGPP